MVSRLICGFISLSLLLSACCDCDKSAATGSDSARLAKDTVPPHFRSAEFKTFNAFPGLPPRRIPHADALRAARFNKEFPVLKAEGEFVDGFKFAPDDFTTVTGLKPASVFFQIGVSNFSDSARLRSGASAPSYTIIVIPVDANNNQMKDQQTGELLAFDFTCPFPANTSCCPKQ